MSAWIAFAAMISIALLYAVFLALIAGTSDSSIADENEGLPWPLDGEDDL